MGHGGKVPIVLMLLVLASCPLFAHDESDDDPAANTNLGFPLGVPVNPTAQYASIGAGIVAGAGYNFTRRHGVVVEFLWNRLSPTSAAVESVRQALQRGDVSGRSDLIALTANYRLELRGRVLGTYFIGGGGLYHRRQHLSQEVPSGTTITCSPFWLWWGFSCESGTITTVNTVASFSSTSPGVNGGIGFTARVGEAPYRMYVESRYHYAPSRNISTQLVSITVGIRY